MSQTAERVSFSDPSDNFVFQRSLLAYVYASERVFGKVLEIGTGSGYGIHIVAPHTEHFTTVDKHHIPVELIASQSNAEFRKMCVPSLAGFADESFDFVISFQVIEHIADDRKMIDEVYRVLRKGGKFIVSTPNKPMSLTRNPWHVREYTAEELQRLLGRRFQKIDAQGVFGKEKIWEYYRANKESVRKIARFDILDLQHRLPRRLLQLPYDILNRRNRRKLLHADVSLTSSITMNDYYMAAADEKCFDLLFLAEK